MQASEIGPHCKDVQLLLWAAGEAHARSRQPEPVPPALEGPVMLSLPDGSEFFTEWQPTDR